jgi:hypothetical protein
MQVWANHNLPISTALSKVRNFGANLPDTYKRYLQNLKVNWVGQIGQVSFNAIGMDFGGKVEVMEKQVLVDFNLPFVLELLRGKIEQEIKDRIREILQAP